jgi:SPP1 gp7 family putative phage head morphogenesis protein
MSGAEIAAVAAVLAAGPPLLAAVQAISVAVKTPKKLVLAALAAIKYKPGKMPTVTGSNPLAEIKKKNRLYRAAYLINAVQRLATATDLAAGIQREKQLFSAHVQASTRRTAAAKASIKMTAATHSKILGWGGLLDDRTTPDCRWLIGKNYSADSPPEGLHPGSRHPNCRCFPAPAWPGKPVVTELPAHLS